MFDTMQKQPTNTEVSTPIETKKLTIDECDTPAKRLEFLAQWLESGAAAQDHVTKFDMRAVIDPGSRKQCGAVCCIMGAANVFWGTGWDDKYNKINYGCDNEHEAAELLGLSIQEASELFYAFGADVSLRIIKPAWAARCIRKFQRDGVIDWESTKHAKG